VSTRVRVGFIGGGKMGGAIVHGLLERGAATPDDIVVCEPVAARREELRRLYGVTVTDEYAPAVNGMDATVLAVRPQDFPAMARQMRPALPSNPLLVSIMAGVRLDTITSALPTERAVRVMPNLGATVGESYSMWYATPAVGESGRALVRLLLGAIGRERETSVEEHLDMAVAVAGSGPGYVTLLVEAMVDGAVHVGLSRQVATEMVLQTFLGTIRWAQAEGRHPAELRAQVVSPAGTTAEGVLALERGGVRAALIEAVIAGYEKSKALG
jgi:pyrroline-5-carboxylate reductase